MHWDCRIGRNCHGRCHRGWFLLLLLLPQVFNSGLLLHFLLLLDAVQTPSRGGKNIRLEIVALFLDCSGNGLRIEGGDVNAGGQEMVQGDRVGLLTLILDGQNELLRLELMADVLFLLLLVLLLIRRLGRVRAWKNRSKVVKMKYKSSSYRIVEEIGSK